MVDDRHNGKTLAAALVLSVIAMQTGYVFAQRSVAEDTVSGAAKGAVIGAIAGDAGSALMGGISRNR